MGTIDWVLATHNSGKLRELNVILHPFPVRLRSLADLEIEEESPESGNSFLENAMQKAKFYYDLTGMPVLADDSGLEVDALNGAPGIHSARFGGFDTHAEKIDYLLDLIKDVPPEFRTARFQCTAVYFDGMRYISAQGGVEGYLGDAPVGDGGFGYDPIFYPEPDGLSFGQLDMETKNRISHRGKAFKSLIRAVNQLDLIGL